MTPDDELGSERFVGAVGGGDQDLDRTGMRRTPQTDGDGPGSAARARRRREPGTAGAPGGPFSVPLSPYAMRFGKLGGCRAASASSRERRMSPDQSGGATPAGLMPIGELSRRSGVPVTVLRTWEERYGLPRPRRTPSGQRRYGETDRELLARVAALRERGMSLAAAMAYVKAQPEVVEPSVFASLRRRHPELDAQLLAKPVLLALSRAVEDECCARAERPLLLAGFQRREFYGASARRWAELARTSLAAVVFADFTRSGWSPPLPAEVALGADGPMLREWFLVCDAVDHQACLAGWEVPRSSPGPDRARRFEVVWSVDPQVVRDAAHVATTIALEELPALTDPVNTALAQPAPAASADLRRANGVMGRALAYLGPGRWPGRDEPPHWPGAA